MPGNVSMNETVSSNASVKRASIPASQRLVCLLALLASLTFEVAAADGERPAWAFALVELVEKGRIATIEVAHAVGEIGFGSSQVDVEVVVEQHDGEDSPTAAACDALEEPPPVTAVVVIEHDVSAFEAALGDVMDSVGNVEAVGARHDRRPADFGLRVPLRSGAVRFWGRVPVLGSGVPIS